MQEPRQVLVSPRLIGLFFFLPLLVTAACGQSPREVADLRFEKGFIRFTEDATWWELRGEMDINIFDTFVIVEMREKDETYIIPRERITYGGHELMAN